MDPTTGTAPTKNCPEQKRTHRNVARTRKTAKEWGVLFNEPNPHKSIHSTCAHCSEVIKHHGRLDKVKKHITECKELYSIRRYQERSGQMKAGSSDCLWTKSSDDGEKTLDFIDKEIPRPPGRSGVLDTLRSYAQGDDTSSISGLQEDSSETDTISYLSPDYFFYNSTEGGTSSNCQDLVEREFPFGEEHSLSEGEIPPKPEELFPTCGPKQDDLGSKKPSSSTKGEFEVYPECPLFSVFSRQEGQWKPRYNSVQTSDSDSSELYHYSPERISGCFRRRIQSFGGVGTSKLSIPRRKGKSFGSTGTACLNDIGKDDAKHRLPRQDKLTLTIFEEAARKIGPRIYKTPLLLSRPLSTLNSGAVYVKLESEQVAGSYGARGIWFQILSYSARQIRKGFLFCSTSTHNEPFALAIEEYCSEGIIFIEEDSGVASMLQDYETVSFKVTKSKKAAAEKYAGRSGKVLLDKDSTLMLAGHGTVAREIFLECRDVEFILVSIGSGDLVVSIASYLGIVRPSIQIIGCALEDHGTATKTDNLGTNNLFAPFCHVKKIVLVSEEEMTKARHFLQEKHKKTVGHLSAVAVAAFVKIADEMIGKTVAIVASDA